MLPGVTAAGAEGEAPSPARPGSPKHEENKGSSQRGKENEDGSFSLSPSTPAARHEGTMRPQLCGAVLGPAGSAVPGAGEIWGGSKSPSPPPSPPGSPHRLCGMQSIPRIRANGGGLIPLCLVS